MKHKDALLVGCRSCGARAGSSCMRDGMKTAPCPSRLTDARGSVTGALSWKKRGGEKRHRKGR